MSRIVTSSATIFVAVARWGSPSIAPAFVGWDGAVGLFAARRIIACLALSAVLSVFLES